MKPFLKTMTRRENTINPEWSYMGLAENPAYNVFYALSDDDTQLYLGWNRWRGSLYALIGIPKNDYISVLPYQLIYGLYSGLWKTDKYTPQFFTAKADEGTKTLMQITEAFSDLPDASKYWLKQTIQNNLDVIRQNIRDSMEGFEIAARVFQQFDDAKDQIQALIHAFPEHQILAEGYYHTANTPPGFARVHIVRTEKGVPFVFTYISEGNLHFKPFGQGVELYPPELTLEEPSERYTENVILTAPTILKPKRITSFQDNRRHMMLYYVSLNPFNPAFVLQAKSSVLRPLSPITITANFIMHPLPMKGLYGLAKGMKLSEIIQRDDFRVLTEGA